MGFRISTEVGRLGLDMVWAEIAVAALSGIAVLRAGGAGRTAVTFWHPSQRELMPENSGHVPKPMPVTA